MGPDRRPHPGSDTRPRPRPGGRPRPGSRPEPRAGRSPHRGRPVAPSRRRVRRRVPLADAPRRLQVALIAVAVALSLCAGRLLQLQGFDSAAYAAVSTEQLTRTLPLLPSRGEITDRNGVVLASTQAAVAITADPTLTASNADQIANVIQKYLQVDRPTLMAALTKTGTRFVYLEKKVPALTYSSIAAELSQLDIPGVYRESDPIRTYPGGSSAASVVGFVGADGAGLGGLEYSENTSLAGTEGEETYESAPNGGKIPLGPSSTTPAKDGLNYQLTLDSELQWVAEQELRDQVTSSQSDSGFAITLDVKTGEVLAMANAPTFDASNPGAAKAADRGNRAISAPYEPGSVEKVLTSAAIIDSGAKVGGQPIGPNTRVVVPGTLRSGPLRIKDFYRHGELHYLMRGIIAHSLNIGAALLARQMPKEQLIGYLKSFGLGAATGIELPGEAAGILPKPSMPNYTRDQIAFGQALSVTGIQEAAAMAGLVDGGVYHPPTILQGATDSAGHAIAVGRRPARQVVSAHTSAQIRDLMQAVTDASRGTHSLRLDGYDSGGKTGTAQLANAKCSCYRGYVTSYVSVAPIDDPQLLTYVVMNNPRHGDTGTSVAAPVAKAIMQYALPRYSVPPTVSTHKPMPTTW
jgi:cell division protein FtsI (penicillin-binding protein 3)